MGVPVFLIYAGFPWRTSIAWTRLIVEELVVPRGVLLCPAKVKKWSAPSNSRCSGGLGLWTTFASRFFALDSSQSECCQQQEVVMQANSHRLNPHQKSEPKGRKSGRGSGSLARIPIAAALAEFLTHTTKFLRHAAKFLTRATKFLTCAIKFLTNLTNFLCMIWAPSPVTHPLPPLPVNEVSHAAIRR